MKNDEDEKPLSALVGERGIRTTKDFADFMGALMADLVAGRVDAASAQAACKAGDAILKVAQMQMEYLQDGRLLALGGDTPLLLSGRE